MRLPLPLLLLLLCLPAHAATYYIDYVGGSDSNNGTSTSTPWQHCPGDPNATGTAAATVLVGGDTVYFKNDVTYVVGGGANTTDIGILLNRSGTSAELPITYDGSSWGSGTRATITNNHSDFGRVAFSVNNTTRSWLTFRGFLFTNLGGYADDDPVWSGGINCTVDPATDVITTATDHGYTVGTRVVFKREGSSSEGAFPGGITFRAGVGETPYYVKTVPSSTEYTISTGSVTGPTVDITSTGVGQLVCDVALAASNVTGANTVRSGVGISLSRSNSQGGQGFVIDDCVFDRIGTWQGQFPMTGTQSIAGTGVTLQNVTNVTITNCHFSRMKTGLSVNVSSPRVMGELTVTGCTFGILMNWLVDVAPVSSGSGELRNIVFDGCTFYDYKGHDQTNWSARWANGDAPHNNGIFFRTSGSVSTWTNVVVRNSIFRADDQTTGGGTASIFISQGPSVDVYNCLFLNDKHANAHINIGFNPPSQMLNVVRIWNCTFVGGNTHIKATPNPDLTDNHHIEIKNCAFYKTTTSSGTGGQILNIQVTDVTTLISDYNLFFTDAITPVINYDGTFQTLSAWQSATSQDANSVVINPQLVSITGNASTWDVRPSSVASPLVGQGDDLSVSAGFSTDIVGTARGNTWDIGAYQFEEGAISEPGAPSDFVVSTTTSTTILLTWTDNATNEDGFHLERSLTSGSGYVLLSTLGPGTESYLDSGLTPSTTYYYRIRSFNAAPVVSEYASTSGTTDEAVLAPVARRRLRILPLSAP